MHVFVVVHPGHDVCARCLWCDHEASPRRCLYFDRHKPAGRGYGYVGVSRFKNRSDVYLYGKLRRTDFLPAGPDKDDEVLERGYDSVSSDDEDGNGLEYAFPEDGSGDDEPVEGDAVMVSADFL